jgi:hypothetical protein
MGPRGEKTAGAGEISAERRLAIVLCDNAVCYARPYADDLDFVRSAGNGFMSMTLSIRGRLEISVRIRRPSQFVNRV